MAHDAQRAGEATGRRRMFGLPGASSAGRQSGARGARARSVEAARAAPAAGDVPGVGDVGSMRAPAPAVPGAGEAAASGVPQDMARVLAALSTPAMWISASGRVAWAHPSLVQLRLVRRGAINSAEISRMVQRCLASDQLEGRDLTIRRPGRRQSGVRLRVRVAPMTDASVVVLIEDITETERLDHARRDFVANVSHELKTPIGALSLLAEALSQAGTDHEAVKRFSGRILVESRRLTTLVNDLMDLSRLEGVEPLVPAQSVALDEVVAQACDDTRSLAQDKDITYLRGGVAGLVVEGVPEQLATAVRNLIVNAINYSPPATKVAVTTGTTGGWVTIAVTDQGIGIPPAELHRIFERFYRVDPARSRVTGGTGLGLSIVKHVAANHGGDCEVWSKVGEGSTFTIRLPAPRPAKTIGRGPSAVPAPPGSATAGSAPSGRAPTATEEEQ